MIILKNKPKRNNASVDRVANSIAEKIISGQQSLAKQLNKAVNRHPKRRQKWFLWIFCGAVTIWLVLCVLHPFGTTVMSMTGPDYQPAYIGSPSDLPIKASQQTKDSLTTKK